MLSFFRSFGVAVVLSLLVPAFAQDEGAASASPKGRVMIVLDGSGSMLGQVGGEQKIVIARKALADLLNDWDPNVEVGLIAYGHRVKGDCTDIEVLVPCGPVDKAAITAAADNLTPLGKTPLSDATILAAETLKFSEETATVILISDGEETCEKDPCVVAMELEARGVGFTAHVIGFDVSDANHIAQLKCLAENTGGKFFSAADAGELQEALATVAKEVAEEPTEDEPAQAGEFRLAATLSEGGDEINQAMRWTIYEVNESGEQGKRVSSYSDPVVTKLNIPAGDYLVEAVLGAAKVTEPLNTEAGEKVINLNAGRVGVAAHLDENGDALDKDVTWTITSADDSKDRVAYSYDANARFILPEGDYNVEAKWGTAVADEPLSIAAGETTSVKVVLNSGVLAANAVYSADGDEVSKDLSWTITAGKPDLTGKYAMVAHSYNSNPVFRLVAGEYRIQTKVGQTEVEGSVEVKANDRVTTTVVLNAGVLHVKSPVKPKNIYVYSAKVDINGNRTRLSHSYNAESTYTLPEGKYVVTRELAEESTDKEVEVKAGERTEVLFE